MSALSLLMALAVVSAPPTIVSVSIAPIPLGATVEVVGSDFVVDGTSVKLADQAQNVVFVTETKVVFTVSLATPIGPTMLTVKTSEGTAVLPVDVAPAPPKISEVSPNPVLLGALVTVKGSDLLEVTSLTIGDLPCNITVQTDAVIVAEVPFATELIGQATLKISGDHGYDVEGVTVEPPYPAIDGVSPNPVRQGDIVTLTGPIAAWANEVVIGGIQAKVIEATQGEVTAQVPPELPVGPWLVVVKVGDLSSNEVGPLHVQKADPERPRVTAVYPTSVKQGSRVWLIGEHLDQIDTLSHGLIREEPCESRLCPVSTEAVEEGVHTVSISASSGTDVFTLAVHTDDGAVPVIESVSPKPAFRGEELLIQGTDLFETQVVVIGGQTQSIQFVGTDEVRILVHELTPMGSETLFIGGAAAGSNAMTVTVLAPFPKADPGPETDAGTGEVTSPDTTEDTGPLPETTTHDGGAPETNPEATEAPVDDDGCHGGELPAPFGLLALLYACFWTTRRNSRLPLGP